MEEGQHSDKKMATLASKENKAANAGKTNVSGPIFRAAFSDLTNEPSFESPGKMTTVMSGGGGGDGGDEDRKNGGEENDNEAEADVWAAKKRKSLGRRVSFAAKAKVRFIENEEQPQQSITPLNSSDDEIQGHPGKKLEEDGNAFNNDADENVFRIASEKRTISHSALGAESPKSVVSNESIEVEIRDPHSSFSSYDSEMDNNSGSNHMMAADGSGGRRLSTQSVGSVVEDEMELTHCVGGIISSNNQRCHESDDTTMDLTGCIGGILENVAPRIGTSARSTTEVESTRSITSAAATFASAPTSAVAQADSNSYTMDFTSVVKGKIDLASAKPSVPIDDMDMTIVMIKDTIKARQPPPIALAPASPSPFLVRSPNNRTGNGSDRFSQLDSEISFIGDMDDARVGLVHGVSSPICDRMEKVQITGKEQQGEEEDADLTMELFNKYIDTTRLRAMTFGNNTTATGNNNVLGVTTTATTTATATATALPQANLQPPVITASQSMARGTGTPLKNFVLPPSDMTESPTVTMILPRASLKDFLNETGIRFLDNLSSLNRRETTGRPRESEHVSAAKQLFFDVGVSIEGDALEQACGQLAEMIGKLREELGKQEEQFNHSPPLAYLEYQRDGNEKQAVVSKLKTFKSIARLYAKQAWYEWRYKIHGEMNAKLGENVKIAEGRAERVISLNKQVDEMIQKYEPILAEVCQETCTLKQKLALTEGHDAEQAKELERVIGKQKETMVTFDEEMGRLMKGEGELRAALEFATKKKQDLMTKMSVLKSKVDAIPETSPIILDELTSLLALLQGAVGWKLIKLGEDNSITLEHVRSLAGVCIMAGRGVEGGGVGISWDLSRVKSRLLRHAERLIKVDSVKKGWGALSRVVKEIGEGLDGLVHLEKQLSMISVQCAVSVPEVVSEGCQGVPISLSFYDGSSRTKFDILLSVGMMGGGAGAGAGAGAGSNSGGQQSVKYSQFVYFYGKVREENVLDRIQLSLQSRYNPVRRLASSVTEIIQGA